VTSRGMATSEMQRIASWIDRVVATPADDALLTKTASEVKDMCAKFPAPGIRI
jgi:glycine hydroxymethyltransferase